MMIEDWRKKVKVWLENYRLIYAQGFRLDRKKEEQESFDTRYMNWNRVPRSIRLYVLREVLTHVWEYCSGAIVGKCR